MPLGTIGLSLIGMLPPIAFAVSAIFGAALARRLGLERFLILAILAMVAGHLARALAGDYRCCSPVVCSCSWGWASETSCFPAGQALLPGPGRPCHRDLCHRPDYRCVDTGRRLGTGGGGGGVARLARRGPSSRSSACCHGSGVLLAQRRERSEAVKRSSTSQPKALAGRIWRSPTAWVVAIVFAVTSLNAYSMFAWLPEILIQTAGESPVAAGAMLGFYSALGIPFALAAPTIAARMKNIGTSIEIGAAFLVLGNVGSARRTGRGTVALGDPDRLRAGHLPDLPGAHQRAVPHPARFGRPERIRPGGELHARRAGPLLIGLMHEWSGGWAGAYILLIGSAVVAAIGGYLLRKPRFVEDDLQRRAQRLAEG